MVPAGYLLKRISAPPGWLPAAQILDVCSVADCVNDNVVDLQKAWKHNGFGLANDRETLWQLNDEGDHRALDARLFYYEAYEEEIETDGWGVDIDHWRPLTSLPSAGVDTAVMPPGSSYRTKLIGYDVVVSEDFLEHSPLSCNSIATRAGVNSHCLFDTLEAAKAAIDGGVFGNGCEPGVYRIFSVNAVEESAPADTQP